MRTLEKIVSTAKMCDLIVSITTWNVKEYAENCLKSIFNGSTNIHFRIVLLDDASTDGVVEMVKEKFPQVNVLVNTTNQGFIKANNRILREYQDKARYYLLLNADTVVSPDTFDSMVNFMDTHPEVGIAGCKVVKPNGTLDWPCKRTFQTPSIFAYRALRFDEMFPQSKQFGKYHLTYLDENEVHEVDAVCGVFLMIRKETLDQIGLMDEMLINYSDDMDWCYRAKEKGWKVFYYPKTQIFHYKTKSHGTRKRKSKVIYWWYRSTWLVYKKHMAKNYHPLINAAVFLGFCFMCGLSLTLDFLRISDALPSRK